MFVTGYAQFGMGPPIADSAMSRNAKRRVCDVEELSKEDV